MKKLVILLSMFFVLACGSSPKTRVDKLPPWVADQPDLCGVGIHKSRNNLGADREFSIAKGRRDLSRKLETKVGDMIKLYEESGEADSENFNEELSRSVSVSLSKTVINGSNPKKIVIDDVYVYSLVCLNPDSLTNAINQMNTLSQAQRKALTRRAEIANKELAEQMKEY